MEEKQGLTYEKLISYAEKNVSVEKVNDIKASLAHLPEAEKENEIARISKSLFNDIEED